MTTFILKLIALITMAIDHTGHVLQRSYNMDLREVGNIFRIIGRVALPIYAFLIAEGMKRTRNQLKYLARLLAFALISFIPFSLFLNITPRAGMEPVFFDASHTNVFFTLFLGALAIYLYDLIKRTKFRELGFIAPIVCALAAALLKTDYGANGVMIIFLCYLFENRFMKAVPIAAGMAYQYLAISNFTVKYANLTYSFTARSFQYFAAAMVACVFMVLYNGKPGPKKLKWFFYAFYPAHLLILYLLSSWIFTIGR